MKTKFRAWDKLSNSMQEVLCIDWLNEFVDLSGGRFERAFYNVELMQSTGLKDKNGVEIFEGDVVKNSNDEVGYIAFLQQEAGFVVVLKKSDYRLGHRNTGESYLHAMGHEVIGNIYENPDLLEAE